MFVVEVGLEAYLNPSWGLITTLPQLLSPLSQNLNEQNTKKKNRN
jgi:hypothetical protein